jgi:hypothetical protein
LFFPLFARKNTQTAAHKSRADIFKGERRAVKKFERRIFSVILTSGKSKFTVSRRFEKRFVRNFAADIRFDNFKSDLLFRFILKIAPEISRKRGIFSGKYKPLSGG